MAKLPKVLINQADSKSAGGVALRVRTQEAFFELGMRYASGRSGPADLVTAHKWFNVAFARGYRTAAGVRSELAREMSAEEIAAAQREARLFLTRH